MTKFEYACFVSYRNSRVTDGLISTFARELSNALEKVLDAYLYDDISKAENPEMVFFDEKIIEVSDFLPHALGQGLCKSICWITVFTRNYLGGSLWCASELHGMTELQKHREDILQLNKNEHRFILPILLRGDASDLPSIFESQIFTEKFKKFTLASKNIYQDDYFTQYIEELASIIADKQKVLLEKCRENNVNLLDVHKSFALKNVNSANEKSELVAFIEKVKAPKPMAFPTT